MVASDSEQSRWDELAAKAEKLIQRLEFQATWQPVLLMLMLAAGFLVGVFLVVRSLPMVVK